MATQDTDCQATAIIPPSPVCPTCGLPMDFIKYESDFQFDNDTPSFPAYIFACCGWWQEVAAA